MLRKYTDVQAVLVSLLVTGLTGSKFAQRHAMSLPILLTDITTYNEDVSKNNDPNLQPCSPD